MRHRTSIDLIGTILQSANGGTTKAKIYYNSFISYSKLKKYLFFLTENKLIEYIEKEHIYRTTNKGMCLLEAYNGIIGLIHGVSDSVPDITTTVLHRHSSRHEEYYNHRRGRGYEPLNVLAFKYIKE